MVLRTHRAWSTSLSACRSWDIPVQDIHPSFVHGLNHDEIMGTSLQKKSCSASNCHYKLSLLQLLCQLELHQLQDQEGLGLWQVRGRLYLLICLLYLQLLGPQKPPRNTTWYETLLLCDFEKIKSQGGLGRGFGIRQV